MPWGLALDPTDVPGLLAALGFLVFGVWVFLLDPGSRLHRAFASLMVLRAGFLLSVRLGESIFSIAGRMAGYFEVAIPFAALYFGLLYRARVRPAARRFRIDPRRAFVVIGSLALLAEFAYWRDHRLLNEGPFLALFGLTYLAYGLFAFLLAKTATSAEEGPVTRTFAVLGSFGFAIEAAYQATWQVTETATEILGGHPDRAQYLLWYIQISQIGYLIAAALSIGAALVILGRADHLRVSHRWAFAAPVLGASALAIPLAVTFASQLIAANAAGIERWIGVHRVVDGLGALAGLLVVAYAVLRQRLVNIQWKLRLAVRGTTLAGIFLAVLFVISEGVQAVFAAQAESSGVASGTSSVLGIVGAGVVVFALHPVQRLAERLSAKTVPNAKTLDDMSNVERVALYREQAALAWLDGELRRKERLLLDGLRIRLHVPVETAARVEAEVVRSAGTLGAGAERGFSSAQGLPTGAGEEKRGRAETTRPRTSRSSGRSGARPRRARSA